MSELEFGKVGGKFFGVHYGPLKNFQDNSGSGGVDGSNRSGSRDVAVVVAVVVVLHCFW
jgi:hypothetical protein